MAYLSAFLIAVVYVEFVGYWLHKLLHSEKLPWLSRAHMIHHLRDYGPKTPLHRDTYLSSADGRASFLGIGMEWIVPIATILTVSLTAMYFLNIAWDLQIVFVTVAMLWGYFLFGYMHSSLHTRNFWLQKIPFLKKWHRRITQLHDFHHLQISEDGRMLNNYGICFYWFDRVFGTFSPIAMPTNKGGYEAALVRYRNVIE